MLHELLDYAKVEEDAGIEDNKFRTDYLKFIIKCVETKDVRVHMPFIFPGMGASFGVKTISEAKKKDPENQKNGRDIVSFNTRDFLKDKITLSAKIVDTRIKEAKELSNTSPVM